MYLMKFTCAINTVDWDSVLWFNICVVGAATLCVFDLRFYITFCYVCFKYCSRFSLEDNQITELYSTELN